MVTSVIDGVCASTRCVTHFFIFPQEIGSTIAQHVRDSRIHWLNLNKNRMRTRRCSLDTRSSQGPCVRKSVSSPLTSTIVAADLILILCILCPKMNLVSS